jgi:hypothetical protein
MNKSEAVSMNRWEYKYIQFFPDIYAGAIIGVRSGNKHMIVEDGRKTIVLNGEFKKIQVREHGDPLVKEAFIELPEFIDYLNELGREGWEIIGDIGLQPGINFLLKRLVEE